jgi:hypothetical protein
MIKRFDIYKPHAFALWQIDPEALTNYSVNWVKSEPRIVVLNKKSRCLKSYINKLNKNICKMQ